MASIRIHLNSLITTKLVIFFHKPALIGLLFLFIATIFFACSNSEYMGANGVPDSIVDSDLFEQNNSATSEIIDYLPLDDSEYPYAGIPRIVIETDDFREIRDRETEIPAKLQIWGEKAPKSEITHLTIRGRGNISWTDMPKNSYKIDFSKKTNLLGMPHDKDWALIANYADKTLIRNFLMYRLSIKLGSYYAPRCEFVELYLNREYLGVYLLSETIKKGTNRINIPKNETSYIVEFDGKYRKGEQVFFSSALRKGKAFKIHYPKNISQKSLDSIQNHIENFELFLKNIKSNSRNNLESWIDVQECIKYYWLQEFSKNPDTGIFDKFFTSVYFSYIDNDKIKMGPVWDFDLAFGNHPYDSISSTSKWHIRRDWYQPLFKDTEFQKDVKAYWEINHTIFESVLDSIDFYKNYLKAASKNNFKRWNILGNKGQWLLKKYSSYDEAIDDLKNWTRERLDWINGQYETISAK